MENNSKQGLVKNLSNQVNAFYDDWNFGGYRSRERNRQANLRFAKCLGAHTNLRKMKNVETQYLYDYVDYMKEKGLAASTIMSDISGIRKYFKHNGRKNHLPENKKFDLQKQQIGKYDRAWLAQEISRAYAIAKKQSPKKIWVFP